MDVPLERSTALKPSSTHLGAFPDTEMVLSGQPLVLHLMHAATTFEPWELKQYMLGHSRMLLWSGQPLWRCFEL